VDVLYGCHKVFSVLSIQTFGAVVKGNFETTSIILFWFAIQTLDWLGDDIVKLKKVTKLKQFVNC